MAFLPLYIIILRKIKKKNDKIKSNTLIMLLRFHANRLNKYVLKVFQHNITKCLRLVQVRLWFKHVKIMEKYEKIRLWPDFSKIQC